MSRTASHRSPREDLFRSATEFRPSPRTLRNLKLAGIPESTAGDTDTLDCSYNTDLDDEEDYKYEDEYLLEVDLRRYPKLRENFFTKWNADVTEFLLEYKYWLVLEHWLANIKNYDYAKYVTDLTEEASELAQEKWEFSARHLINPPPEIIEKELVPGKDPDEEVSMHSSYYRQRFYRQRILLHFVGWICNDSINVYAVKRDGDYFGRSGLRFWQGLNERFKSIRIETLGLWKGLRDSMWKRILHALPQRSIDYLTGADYIAYYVPSIQTITTANPSSSGGSEEAVNNTNISGDGYHNEGKGAQPAGDGGSNKPEHGNLSDSRKTPSRYESNRPPRGGPPGPPGPETYGEPKWKPPHPAYRPPAYLAEYIPVNMYSVDPDPVEEKQDGGATGKQRSKKGEEKTTFDMSKGNLIRKEMKDNKPVYICIFPVDQAAEPNQNLMKGECGRTMDPKYGENNLKRHTQQHLNLGVHCPDCTSEGGTCNHGPRTRQDKLQEHYTEKHTDNATQPRSLITNFLLALGRVRTMKPNWIAGVYWSRGDGRELRREDNLSRPALDHRRNLQRRDFYRYALWVLLSSGQHCRHLQDTIELCESDREIVLQSQNWRVMHEIKYLEEKLLRHSPHQLWSGRRCIYGRGEHKNGLNTSMLGMTIAPLPFMGTANSLNLPKPLAANDPNNKKYKRAIKRKAGNTKSPRPANAPKPSEAEVDKPPVEDDLAAECGTVAVRKYLLRDARLDDYALRLENPPPPCDFLHSRYCQKCLFEVHDEEISWEPDHQVLMDYWVLPPGELFHVDILHGLQYWVDRNSGLYWCQWMVDGSIRQYHPETLTYGAPPGKEGADHPYRLHYLKNVEGHGKDYIYRVNMAHHMVNQSRAVWNNYNRATRINDPSIMTMYRRLVQYYVTATHRWIAYSQPRLGNHHPEAPAARAHGDVVEHDMEGTLWKKIKPIVDWNNNQDRKLESELLEAYQNQEQVPDVPTFTGALPVDTMVPSPWAPGREILTTALPLVLPRHDVGISTDELYRGGEVSGGSDVTPNLSISLDELATDDVRDLLGLNQYTIASTWEVFSEPPLATQNSSDGVIAMDPHMENLLKEIDNTSHVDYLAETHKLVRDHHPLELATHGLSPSQALNARQGFPQPRFVQMHPLQSDIPKSQGTSEHRRASGPRLHNDLPTQQEEPGSHIWQQKSTTRHQSPLKSYLGVKTKSRSTSRVPLPSQSFPPSNDCHKDVESGYRRLTSQPELTRGSSPTYPGLQVVGQSSAWGSVQLQQSRHGFGFEPQPEFGYDPAQSTSQPYYTPIQRPSQYCSSTMRPEHDFLHLDLNEADQFCDPLSTPSELLHESNSTSLADVIDPFIISGAADVHQTSLQPSNLNQDSIGFDEYIRLFGSPKPLPGLNLAGMSDDLTITFAKANPRLFDWGHLYTGGEQVTDADANQPGVLEAFDDVYKEDPGKWFNML